MLTMRWLLLSIALLVGGAQSQESSDDKAVTQKDKSAEQKNADSKRTPASSKGKKSTPIKKSGNQNDAHSDDKLKIDREIAKYTGELAVYTKELSKYTGDVANFTFALVIATIVLGLLGLWQGFVSTKEMMFANRPRLVARKFRLHMPEVGKQPMIEFVVANVGNSKAYVTWDNVTFKVLTQADLETLERLSFPPIEGQQNQLMLRRKHYTPTKRLAHAVVLQGIQDVPAAFAAVRAREANFVCFGFIRYRDALFGRYETHFFRTYREGEELMIAHVDPDFDDHSESQD